MGLPEDGLSGHSEETSRFSMYLRRGDSTDVLYPHVGMEIIWLSDSSNWMRQGQYLVVRHSQSSKTNMWFTQWAYLYTWWQPWSRHCELETDRSRPGTWPRILASTCNAFYFWLCNARVSGRGCSWPGRPSSEPRKCTWMMASEERPFEGGCMSYIQILGARAIDNQLARKQVV